MRNLIPALEDARIVSFGTQVGVRETRRIYGDYRLTREDVLGARKFEDSIGLSVRRSKTITQASRRSGITCRTVKRSVFLIER